MLQGRGLARSDLICQISQGAGWVQAFREPTAASPELFVTKVVLGAPSRSAAASCVVIGGDHTVVSLRGGRGISTPVSVVVGSRRH